MRTGICWAKSRKNQVHVLWAPHCREPWPTSRCIPLCKGFLQVPWGLLCLLLSQDSCKYNLSWRQPLTNDYINSPNLRILVWKNSGVCSTLAIRAPYWGEFQLPIVVAVTIDSFYWLPSFSVSLSHSPTGVSCTFKIHHLHLKPCFLLGKLELRQTNFFVCDLS